MLIVFQPLWKAAVSQFERIIAPAEKKVASKLKKFISDIQDSPQQVQAFLQSENFLMGKKLLSS